MLYNYIIYLGILYILCACTCATVPKFGYPTYPKFKRLSNPYRNSSYNHLTPTQCNDLQQLLIYGFHSLIKYKIPKFDISVSDGCTGVRQIGKGYCQEHDLRYWYGMTWRDKWVADYMLFHRYWNHLSLITKEQQPYLSHIAWKGLAIIRFLGVILFANKAFWNKQHKYVLGNFPYWRLYLLI